MPINFIATVFVEGKSAIPYYEYAKVVIPVLVTLWCLKWYFSGARNTWERDMHGRVILITGGTSGLGAVVAKEMAMRGAQVILLVKSLKDGWLAEYIEDLREVSGNPCIYAEETNLADLMSVRKFATKWIDNMPPRRVDAVVCCAGVALPPGTPRTNTVDGLETQFQVNYLGHYHLLTTLTPALRSQPPDREVRVILVNCISSVMANLDLKDLTGERSTYPKWSPYRVMGSAKLALGLFGMSLQRQMNSFQRKDGVPCHVHVAIVDPGMMRSPSFKRFFSLGSIYGLLVYIVLWPLWWLFLKSSVDGSQSVLFALMARAIGERAEVSYVQECDIRASLPPRKEYSDETLQDNLFELSGKILIEAEKETARQRARQEQTHDSQHGHDGHDSRDDTETVDASVKKHVPTASAKSRSPSKSALKKTSKTTKQVKFHS